MNRLMSTPLRWQSDATNFLDLRFVRGRNTVEVPGDLGPQVTDHDKLLEDIFGENVSESGLLDFVRVDVNMIGTQMQIRR